MESLKIRDKKNNPEPEAVEEKGAEPEKTNVSAVDNGTEFRGEEENNEKVEKRKNKLTFGQALYKRIQEFFEEAE